ncbi:helix-turn-helix domain-containing protein [Streptomyces arenae]|uniref:helix-turn-helix domain-containing protein n=1 Tax=Streptomyces arenae TaxID=29301 RepID=UPI00265A4A64|nr:helix-turn-helix domain-containing protein [Streptomyces arenae]MCG7210123.1 helix-turn-helix domain-containing protein [Streptomyces arenae]
MTSNAHLKELGELLKNRRGELSPRTVGLPGTGTRRVPGLRREEVAQLASVRTEYYTRIEQGRIPPTGPVLQILARVLHLSDEERDRVFELAGKGTDLPRRHRVQKTLPVLQQLLDDLAFTPAIVMGRRMDILAWNTLGAALVTDFSQIPHKHRNFVRVLFTDPAMRTLCADWDSVARLCVAMLRAQAAKHPGDPHLATLVGELSVRDDDFRTWWGSHKVTSATIGAKALRHPVAGDLALKWDTLTLNSTSDQHLTVWTAEPGSPSHDGLRLLAAWTASFDGNSSVT